MINNNHMGEQIWRLMDERVLRTAEFLRHRFGTMIINDYIWYGSNQYRGFRPWTALLNMMEYCSTGVARATWSSFHSQHCFGRAIDAKFKSVTAEEIRLDIKANPERKEYQFITCVEDGVDWLHFDCRSWSTTPHGILFVTP